MFLPAHPLHGLDPHNFLKWTKLQFILRANPKLLWRKREVKQYLLKIAVVTANDAQWWSLCSRQYQVVPFFHILMATWCIFGTSIKKQCRWVLPTEWMVQ
jgi:hypothetical protein